MRALGVGGSVLPCLCQSLAFDLRSVIWILRASLSTFFIAKWFIPSVTDELLDTKG